VPGGRGPQPWVEGFWADWNPRYASGGADQSYPTPPPRFASYVVDELVPFVEHHLPVARGRAARALGGTSLGGYGSYAIGLTHPDMWSSIGAVSGIMNILLAHAVDPAPGTGTAIQPPLSAPTLPTPTLVGGRIPLSDLPGPAADLGAVFYVFGDPSTEQAYYRGAQPVDLASNAVARRGSRQSLVIRGFSNDTVPRLASDVTSFPGYLVAQGFEDFVLASNVEMNRAFADEGVSQHYELHPGIHSDTYWNPWLRTQVQAQYDALRHWDGSGHPPPLPTTFSYGSEAASFSVWGWSVTVHRPVVEFLRLTDVSCRGFTVRGTGVVKVVVPRSCGTGVRGSRTVTLDLGPSMPTDSPAGADAAGDYGRTVHVRLARL
jgi:S-formylglutathione hydrolase FrmB